MLRGDASRIAAQTDQRHIPYCMKSCSAMKASALKKRKRKDKLQIKTFTMMVPVIPSNCYA